MKLLTLMRHAKSSWATDFHSDKSRTLNDRGRRDAPMMSRRVFDSIGSPDFIICSSSNRTRETADFILTNCKMSAKKISYSDRLYLASPGEMLKQIEMVDPKIKHLLVVAHNPGTEMLGQMLHPNAPKTLPTSGVLHFAISSDSFHFTTRHSVKLLLHDFPKNTELA